MIAYSESKIIKSYGRIALEQNGIKLSRILEICQGAAIQYIPKASNPLKKIRKLSDSPEICEFPNQTFINAADEKTIERYIMSMDPNGRLETQAILENQDVMDALERADCQYKEGRAKPLRALIKDLGFDADALLD